MTDDNLDDTQQSKEEQFNPPLTAKQLLDRRGSVGIEKAKFDWNVMTEWENEIWNAAIEAAMNEIKNYNFDWLVDRIRKLKK